MQLMIDTGNATRAELDAAIGFLSTIALLKGVEVPMGTEAAGEQAHRAAEQVLGLTPAPPAPPAPPAAEVFGGNTPVHAMAPPPPPPAPPFVPPAAPAPAIAGDTPAAVVTATASPSDLDSTGMPWDARLHSETKKKNADGSWRVRRGLDKNVRVAVEAELRAIYPDTSVNLHAVPPVAAVPAASVPAPPPPPPAAAVVPAPPAPNAGAVPPPPPPAGVAAAVLPGAITFHTLMAKLTNAANEKKISMAQITEAITANGVAGFGHLSKATPEQLVAIDLYVRQWGV